MENILPALTTTNLAWPTDWTAIFGTDRPLIFDIGFGYGHSLAYLHHARPDHNIIGLEVDNISLTKAERRIIRDGWHNVRAVYGFADTALVHLFRPQTLSEVHMNFPDPWFKTRHAGRRLMQRTTLDAITNRLMPGGLFYLATDIIEYAEMSAELLQITPTLTNLLNVDWVTVRPEPFTTKYEARAQKQGRPCYYFSYRRNDTPAPEIPAITELEMPHIVFKTSDNLSIMTQAAQPQNHQDGQVAIKFLERYHSEKATLFEVFVHEPTLDQRIAFALVRRDDEPGVFTLKLSALGHPRSTEGVHKAARILADAILSTASEVVVIQDKLKIL